jgi:hypothetical protein
MWIDEIVEEVRAIREAHAARLGYDLDAIYQDLKEQEQQSRRQIVAFSSGQRHPQKEAMSEPLPVMG